MESWLFLGIILLVAILAKNQSLMIAAAFVLIMKLIPASRSFFPWLQGKGNQYWGDDHHSGYSNPYRNRRNRST